MEDLHKDSGYNRIFYQKSQPYHEPFLSFELLKVQAKHEDEQKLRSYVKQANSRGIEMMWASLDAVVWLATCMREMDSQMELSDQDMSHPWVKEKGYNVYRYVGLFNHDSNCKVIHMIDCTAENSLLI